MFTCTGMIGASVMPLVAHLVDARHVVVYGSVYSLAQIAICFGFAIGQCLYKTYILFFYNTKLSFRGS